MLKEIAVLRFKAIEKLILPLERINFLIGANNSGKSSVLQAIQFAISVAQTMKNLGAEWRNGEMKLSLPADQLVYSPLPSLQKPQIEALLQRATDDIADESLKAYINYRLQVDSRRLKREGKQVNIGALSVDCTNAFNAHRTAFRHGKKVLSRLRHLLHTELKLNRNPIQSSVHVSSPNLVTLATKLSRISI